MASYHSFSVNETDFLEMLSQLGLNQQQQQQKLKERLKRRQELMNERNEAGLNADEAVIESLLDEEEETEMRKKRKVWNRKKMLKEMIAINDLFLIVPIS